MKGLRIKFSNGDFKQLIKILSLIFVILAFSNIIFPFAHSQNATPKKVLILNSYHNGFPWEDNIVDGIETTFDSSDETIELTIEYMDSKNNLYNDTYKQMLYDLYSYKYAQANFDVVITTDDNALNFLMDYHDGLFPSVPVVFCGVNNFNAPSLVNRSLYTGMLEIVGYNDTVELMLNLHPETNKIIAIMCNTPTGNYAWEQFVPIIPLFPEISITRINTSYSTEELKSFVGNQNEDTLFLYYSWYRDGNDTYYTLKDGTELISQACSRPLFGLHVQALNYGVVGGKLLSGTYHGISTANMVLRILAGESPSEIEIIDEVYAEYMFNYEQLMHWGIELSDLPQDSVIVNSPFNFYQEYKLVIWLVIGIVISLLGIILVLTLTITKRHQIEKELIKAQKSLKEHSENLEEMVEIRTKEVDDVTEQLVRKEKLAVLGQLSGAIGHELRNPLGAIKNVAYFLNIALEDPDPEVKESLAILEKEVIDSEKIITNMLSFAQSKPIIQIPINLNDVINNALIKIILPNNIKLMNKLEDSLPILRADPDLLALVFGNIILNGIQAMPEGGKLTIESSSSEQDYVSISITDTGSGISDDVMKRLFEPLFTTKARGIGLGLAITKDIVEKHGGSIEIQSKVGKGTTFTIKLPISSKK